MLIFQGLNKDNCWFTVKVNGIIVVREVESSKSSACIDNDIQVVR